MGGKALMDVTADEPLTCPTKPPTIEGVGAVHVAADPAYLAANLRGLAPAPLDVGTLLKLTHTAPTCSRNGQHHRLQAV
jgi:hypothetical protein